MKKKEREKKNRAETGLRRDRCVRPNARDARVIHRPRALQQSAVEEIAFIAVQEHSFHRGRTIREYSARIILLRASELS